MIFYFTGTGNSLYVAKQLDAERISIPQALKQENMTFEAPAIGVVCPVYGQGVFAEGYFSDLVFLFDLNIRKDSRRRSGACEAGTCRLREKGGLHQCHYDG